MSEFPDMRARDREGLSKIFRYYAQVETPRMDSPVYTAYSFGVADEPEILDLCAQIDGKQPAPNVLYAAVQDLLMQDARSTAEARALTHFYPAIGGDPIPERSPWEAFRAFCLANADRLGPSLREGRTQTCVVHRCTSILPALASLPSVGEAKGRVALLEIGPSAGLNLRFDRYAYDYGGGIVWGEADAKPVLHCEIRGEVRPPMPSELEIVARRGLDLNPIDLADPKSLRWLRALIWPEHAERARVMNEALALATSVPIEIEAGDATRDLGAAIAKLPDDCARVLFATQVFYQIPQEGRMKILEAMARASRDASLDFVLMESTGEGDSRIEWFGFANGENTNRTTLARADSHGRWIEWGAA